MVSTTFLIFAHPPRKERGINDEHILTHICVSNWVRENTVFSNRNCRSQILGTSELLRFEI